MRTSLAFALLVASIAMPADQPKKNTLVNDSIAISDKLLERFDVPEGLESFGDALDWVKKATELNFIIDAKAFGEEHNSRSIREMKIDIPGLKAIRVQTFLKLIVDQIKGDYMIMADHVSITSPLRKNALTNNPIEFQLEQVSPKSESTEEYFEPADRVRNLAFVTVSYKEKPLNEILQDLSSRTSRNAILTAGVTERSIPNITIELKNVTFEAAVASVAEASGFRAVKNGNVVMVVSMARYKQLKEESKTPPLSGVSLMGRIVTLEELEQISRVMNKTSNADVESLRAEIAKIRKDNDRVLAEKKLVEDQLMKLKDDMSKGKR